MTRRLLNLLTLLSLLLCVAVAALWARSYWLEDNVAWGVVKGADKGVRTSDSFPFLVRGVGQGAPSPAVAMA